jgi:hypothetical protein
MFVANMASYLVAVVLAAGIVLTIVRWQRHPRVSLLVVIALGLPLLFDFCLLYLFRLPAVYGWLQSVTPAERRLVFGIHQVLGQTSRAASYVLFLVAAFGRPDDQRIEPQQGASGRGTGHVRPPGLLQKWSRARDVSRNP